MSFGTRNKRRWDFQTAPKPLLLERHNDPLPPRSTSSTDVIRCVFLSDTHGKHDQVPLPEGDVLFHLGDIANRGNLQDIQNFATYLQTQQHNYQDIVVIEGNHDRDRDDPHRIDLKQELLVRHDNNHNNNPGSNVHVLQDEIVTVANGKLRILGTSWDTCERNDMTHIHALATAANHHQQQQQQQQQQQTQEAHQSPCLNTISTGSRTTTVAIDMLLTHINPRVDGRGHGWNGSQQITNLVEQLQIPLHCFGHVHYGRGICDDISGGSSSARRRRKRSDSIMVNCATAWNKPVVIDYCTSQKKVLMVHCPLRKPNMFTPVQKMMLSNIP